MQSKHTSILKAVNNHSNKYNILSFPTHERYQSNLSGLEHTFHLYQGNNIKTWNESYAMLPDNHILLKNEENPFIIGTIFDIVLSQNKFGQFEIAKNISDSLNIPLISLEHTLPFIEWDKKTIQGMSNMRGDFNVYISEYSAKEWGADPNDKSVRIIHHGVDSTLFSPEPSIEKNNNILTVCNDYKNRGWCMPSGQKILTDNGYKNIENISVGNIVLTDSGNYNSVIKTFKREYFGPMVSILVDNNKKPLMFTSDHSVRVLRDSQEKYIEASMLREGDILKFPGHKQNSFYPESIDLSWVIGLIIGDGSLSDTGNIEIVFKTEDTKEAERACDILNKITGQKAYISHRDRNKLENCKTIKVNCTSKIFVSWLKSKIGGKSYNKSIPDFIFNGSQESRLAILQGLWFCDGSFENGKNGSKRSCYSTISGKLASQVSSILHSFGVACNILFEKRTTNKSNRNIVPIYRVTSSGQKFEKCKDLITESKANKAYSYTIKKVDIDFEWRGTVYNCEVSKDQSYVVYPGFVVHNCCGWDIYKEIKTHSYEKLKFHPIGDTPGISKKAEGISGLVQEYRQSYIFLNTSTISPIPCALLEAMSCGLPCVSTNTCMIPEIIKDGVNGFLYPPDKPNIAADRLKLLSKDKELADKMGKEARKTIVEKFSLDGHIKTWDNLFNEAFGFCHKF